MREPFAARLACPQCGSPVRVVGDERIGGEIVRGRVACAACGSEYPIRGGIPRMVVGESLVRGTQRSFGSQWTKRAEGRFEDATLWGMTPAEEQRLFFESLDLRPEDLRGRWVLDAGCGAGRLTCGLARLGANVVGLDVADSIDYVARQGADLETLHLVQGNLLHVPLAEGAFDAARSPRGPGPRRGSARSRSSSTPTCRRHSRPATAPRRSSPGSAARGSATSCRRTRSASAGRRGGRPPNVDNPPGGSPAVRTPFLLVNFKAYPEALGPKAVALAKACALVEEDTGRSLALAPSAFDLGLVAKSVRLPVFAQHPDPAEAGQSTGWVPPEAALAAGAVGTIVNHSERKVAWEEMRDLVRRCHDLGLEVVACADDVAEAETAARLAPDFLAIEPPELIGGEGSVTTPQAPGITKAGARVHAADPQDPVLCGAGGKT